MKRSILIIAPVLSAALLTVGCNEALEYQNVLYFTGSEASNTTTLYVDGTAEMQLSVTSSSKAVEDFDVYVEIDESALAIIGAKMGAEYEMLPYSSFMTANSNGSYDTYRTTLTIKEGSSTSVPEAFHIDNMNDFVEGVNYCIPFRIAGNSKGLNNLASSEYFFVFIGSVIETRAMNLAYTWQIEMEGMKGDPTLDNMDACTLEIRVCAKGISTLSHKISSFIGVEENFLLRMGDGSIEHTQVQYAGKVSFHVEENISLDRWYHLAVVDNGSELTIYIDGEPKASAATTAAQKITNLGYYYNSPFAIGMSASDYRRFNGYVSEARAWRRALTPIELKNNMCFLDVEKAVGLVGYWRCDNVEADGVTVLDLSGNGYHGKASKTVTASDFVTIKCPVLD